ncbi:MAG: DEAD/DEAH box helicase [Sarcina sp.]
MKNEMIEEILNSKEILVDEKEVKDISNTLILNNGENNLLKELKEAFNDCKKFYFSVAFITQGGLQLLLDDIDIAINKGIKGKIITSTYLNFTQPKALERIKEFKNIELKIFITDEKKRGFHTKVYIFEYESNYKIFIGSSNLTDKALKSNEEWNVKIISKKDKKFAKHVMTEFNNLFEETRVVDDIFLKQYKLFITKIKEYKNEKKFFMEEELIKANSMQIKALENLQRLRNHGGKKSLVIAATGTGKTYMSAFDVKQFRPSRMLFIVHREDILRKAKKDYERIIKEEKVLGLFTGNIKEEKSDYLFATIQTMARYYTDFKKDDFDYIVIDEAHHVASETYQRILKYFEPRFLLGMTATPERSEGADIFSIFDNNIALEVRLSEALEEDLVVPFHYFGITDIQNVDFTGIDMNNISEVAKVLQINERVEFIIEKMNFYGYDGEKRKCVGFCVNINHARYMSDEFNKRGIKSIALTGEDSVDKRLKVIKKLEDNNDDLEVIFTVNLFNEGVDIPGINLVLMLRPTESSIIFIQQLGRGLRKFEGKEFLTVLDFIGNHNKAFLIAIALNGSRYYDKDSLKVSIATDFANIRGATHIQMDKISKERILAQIEAENFNSMKYLKEEYLEFKKVRGNKVANLLTDYLLFEGAPNPLKFIKAAQNKTYLGFLEKVEKDFEDRSICNDEKFITILRDLTGRLPIKRPFEFLILRYLINYYNADKLELKNEILKYVESIDENTLEHVIKCLLGIYYDSKQIRTNIIMISDNEGSISLSKEFEKILSSLENKKYVEDCINYGLLKYEKEYGDINYGVPFFKLYKQYQMVDAAILSNYEKTHSSFRGQGLICNNNEWFLFVDLHKDEDIKESINYKDKFLSRELFQWQSPNNTAISSERGQKLINNVEKNINLHVFIRKYKKIDGAVEPYIYIGKGDTVYYEGEKPITVHLKLRNEVAINLYSEFTKLC